MQIIATITVIFVAVIHIVISVVEMFLWGKPSVHQRLGFTADVADQVAPIVKNAGLYNSFIAAGLIWGALTANDFLSIRVFFLVCVVIAGIFGALTLKRTTLVLQTLPASIALFFVWLAFNELPRCKQRGIELLTFFDYTDAPRGGECTRDRIQVPWVEQKAIKEVMLFLQSHGVSTTYAVKIYKKYGDESIAVVTENPYRLATDVYGIGFVTADAIARNLGIEPTSEYRYRSGILHVLNHAAEEGHCFLPQAELVENTVKRLALPGHVIEPKDVEELTVAMSLDEELIMQGGSGELASQFLCYSPPFYRAEKAVADRLRVLLSRKLSTDPGRVQRWLDRFAQATNSTLSEQQRQAVELAATSRVMILTGGPGTGKTTTTRTIVALWKAMGKSIALASPTGRAAQRLSEVTGQEAKTIHRLLKFDPKNMKFKRDQDSPIDADAIVVDEASMLDLFLANSLIKAVSTDSQLLLVGDTDQLPSVGAGAVLKDLIESGCIPVMRLTQVFRQAQASQIVTNAHRINQGKFPQLEPVSDQPKSDCLLLKATEPEDGVQYIQDIIEQLLPGLGYDLSQVQVLCPMTRGEMGTRNLNKVLQALVNPPAAAKPELMRGGMTLRVGDRVIQQVNDYDREVFNGDMGIIRGMDLEEQDVTVQFGERMVSYDYADINEIALAYAVTIHKSQGSEYPVVVMPMFMQHYMMLSRNLLYTGLTRARKLAVLVGSQKAIGIAVKQVNAMKRYTLLGQRVARAAELNH